MMKKNWIYNIPDNKKVKLLEEKLNIPPIISKVLVNRGLDDPTSARKFLSSSLEDLHNPFLLKGMQESVKRILEAVQKKQSIWIYGDYDVDGISATTILLKYFAGIGYEADFYIPDRLEEGYGLKSESIKKIFDQGADLIITVDCGITSYIEVEFANELGLDIIITDHHECQDILPKAVAIINPKQKDCDYPFKHLCGCGIALKLIQALTPREIFKTSIYDYIDLVAMATVADIVSLKDENRIFVKHGLEHFADSKNIGIRELVSICGLKKEKITAGRIGFTIAPRINAAGRIRNASMAVRLLTTESEEEAIELAEILDEENKKRQIIEANIYNEAIEMLENSAKLKKDAFLVLAKEKWHHGVVGIVASRIAEKYYKPTVILGVEDGVAKGSARSIPGFNLFSSMGECADLFEKFGGHEQAAGLTLKSNNIKKFADKINEISSEIIRSSKLSPEIKFDAIITMNDIDERLAEEIERLEPFGLGNPVPKFMYKSINVDSASRVGKEEKHIKMGLIGNRKYVDGIGFNLGVLIKLVKESKKIDIIFTPNFNEYNGRKKIQILIKDIKNADCEVMNQEVLKKNYYNTIQLERDDNATTEFDLDSIDWYLDDIKDEQLFELLALNAPSIILVNTLEKAQYLARLTNIKLNSKETLYKVDFNIIDEKPNANEIHIVINPIIAKIDFTSYNKVILFDLFFSTKDYNVLFERVKNDKIIGFYRKGDEVFNSRVLDSIIPNRDELVAIYKYIKANLCSETEYELDRIVTDLNIHYGELFNPQNITHALNLFRDGNIIEYKLDNRVITIKLLDISGKTDLLQLSRYTDLLNHRENFKSIKKLLERG